MEQGYFYVHLQSSPTSTCPNIQSGFSGAAVKTCVKASGASFHAGPQVPKDISYFFDGFTFDGESAYTENHRTIKFPEILCTCTREINLVNS